MKTIINVIILVSLSACGDGKNDSPTVVEVVEPVDDTIPTRTERTEVQAASLKWSDVMERIEIEPVLNFRTMHERVVVSWNTEGFVPIECNSQNVNAVSLSVTYVDARIYIKKPPFESEVTMRICAYMPYVADKYSEGIVKRFEVPAKKNWGEL